MDLSTNSKCHWGLAASGQEGLMSSEGLTSSETRALLENSLWAAAQPGELSALEIKAGRASHEEVGSGSANQLYGHQPLQKTSSHIACALGNNSAGQCRIPCPEIFFYCYFRSKFSAWAQCLYDCVVPNLFLQEIKVCLIDSRVCPCSGSWSLMFSGPTSSSCWWKSYFSSVILQWWRLRCLSTDPLCHLHCAAPTFWGGIHLYL